MEVTDIPRRLPTQGTLTSDRRLYADASGKIVEADDPNRVTLVAAGEGAPVDPNTAKQYGLTSVDGRLTYAGDAGAKVPEGEEPAAGPPEVQERQAARAERQQKAQAGEDAAAKEREAQSDAADDAEVQRRAKAEAEKPEAAGRAAGAAEKGKK